MALDQGLADEEFCNRFATSLDRLREAVDDFTPLYVADRCGLSVELLQQTVDMFTSARRASAASSTGHGTDPNLAEHLIEAFNAVCGETGRVGKVQRNTGYCQTLGQNW